MIKVNLLKKMLSKYFSFLIKYFFSVLLNRQIVQLLKKVDVLHMKKWISGEDDNDERYFLHTYDDYFS